MAGSGFPARSGPGSRWQRIKSETRVEGIFAATVSAGREPAGTDARMKREAVTVVADSTAQPGKRWWSLSTVSIGSPNRRAPKKCCGRGADPGGDLYGRRGSDSLLEMEEDASEWVENNEISARNYRDTAVARNGSFWLATADGLFNCLPRMAKPAGCAESSESLVHCLAEDQAGGSGSFPGSGLHMVQG